MEPRRQARSYLLGLLADVETRSCWQLAEHAGDQSPHRMQRLLGEAVWDADAVRDDVRGYVADELGDSDLNPDISAIVHPFLRSSGDSNPRTYAEAYRRGSTRANRPA